MTEEPTCAGCQDGSRNPVEHDEQCPWRAYYRRQCY